MTATQVLAATITIAFEGLMLFQGPSTSAKTHVAIVKAEDHEPSITVIDKTGQIINQKNLDEGDVIDFGIDGIAQTDDWFHGHVIRLKAHVAFGNVDEEVVLKNVKHPGTFARVDLPEGDLTILFTFRKPVELDSWMTLSSKHCFPRYVLLKPKLSSPVTMKIKHNDGSSKPIETPDDAIVIISNNGSPNSKHPHFHEYRKMLGTFAFLETAKLLDEPPCYPNEKDPKPVPPGLDPNIVEILRKRITPPVLTVPNGDCGPVNNP